MNTDHPSEQELLQFAAGELDEPRFEQIATHLEDCEQCGDVLRKTGAFPKLGDGPLSLPAKARTCAERKMT